MRAAVLLLWPLLLSSVAPPSGSPAETSREAALAAIRRQVAELETRLGEMRREQTRLEGRLARVDVELELQQAQVAEAKAALSLTEERIAESDRRVAGLESALSTARTALERRMASLYRVGRGGYLRLFLSVRPDADLLEALRLLRFLARRDSQAVDLYVHTRDELAEEQGRLAAQHRELDAWAAREEERRAQLAAVRGRQRALLARLSAERRDLSARASSLEDKARKLSSLIDALYGASGSPLDGRPIQGFRGVLDWPVHGEVTAGYGPRSDPRYRTQVPHNGIDIAAPEGVEVRVVYPGKVLFAAPFQGYGDTVVVHHPGRVFTLYAGLSRLRVQVGDMLSLNDVVGVSSGQLYFEIRVENRPEDPLQWLR